jgi:hypothetical protein
MLSQSDRRTHGAHKFRQIQSSKDFYKFSFIPNTISAWNSLPQSITLSPNLHVESFKSGISTLTFEGFPTLKNILQTTVHIYIFSYFCLVIFVIIPLNCPCTVPGRYTLKPLSLVLYLEEEEEEHTSSSPVFSGVRTARYLAFCVMFCRSLFVLFRLVIVLSVLLRFTASDYPFDIFKLS